MKNHSRDSFAIGNLNLCITMDEEMIFNSCDDYTQKDVHVFGAHPLFIQA